MAALLNRPGLPRRNVQLPREPNGEGARDTQQAAASDQLAAIARTAYCLAMREHSQDPTYGNKHMPQWDGGLTAMGTYRKPVWPAVAQTLLVESADPYLYMAAQFTENKATHQIRPNQLSGPQAIARWRDYQANAPERLRQQRVRELASVESHVLPYTQKGLSFERAMALALGNTTTNCATPLLRHSLADRAGLLDVARFFYDAALLQYLFQQAPYDAAWGDILSVSLCQAGRDLKQRLLGG